MTDTPEVLPNSETLERCPCCGSTSFRPTRAAGLARCPHCHAYFQNPRPRQIDIMSSYDTGLTYASWQRDNERRQVLTRRRLNLFRSLCRGNALLDVGCGDGRFMALAAEAGFHVTGTELSEAAATLVRKKGMQVHMGQLTEINLPRTAFDAVTLWHVLEHVPFPGATIARCVELLKPGGILVLATPNALHDLFRLYLPAGRPPFPTVHSQGSEIHLTQFTPKCLRGLLQIHGLKVLEFGVDPVHRDSGVLRFIKNTMLHAQTSMGWHLGVAMHFVARKVHDTA
ncbi:MAG: class I SAM-dependent methyltransferase [Lentisphaerae bacterium]|nr:class I SAM-dependent methyltransferase [Lentisphaerota bacterium]